MYVLMWNQMMEKLRLSHPRSECGSDKAGAFSIIWFFIRTRGLFPHFKEYVRQPIIQNTQLGAIAANSIKLPELTRYAVEK